MILSASRRTDIPGCYPEWFMNRLRDGYVMTRNPMNCHQVSRIETSPELIECIVFWTKNAIPLMDYLDELERMGYMYMFQYTVTPYDRAIEKNLPDKKEIIKNILELSDSIGKDRIVWRYDPILLNDNYTIDYHIKMFEEMCVQLRTAVNHVVISFIDSYKKNRQCKFKELSIEDINILAQEIGKISQTHKIPIKTCCENYDLECFGIKKGACIDRELIERICNRPLKLKKAIGQREGCFCSESIDIGMYHTCMNGCMYCYATDYKTLETKHRDYNKNSEILCDKIDEQKDIVKTRKIKKL